ncbi:MAG: helix-turn-helix domain-containing protein [Salinarimonadaceae bacterium]|nr:MAG: helix-turn-helix domain-containing protein [Salinarimonadaceae bacterium]
MGNQSTTLGRVLRVAMQTKGVNASELSRRIERSRGYVSSLINGQSKNPGSDEIRKISRALDIDIMSVVEGLEIAQSEISDVELVNIMDSASGRFIVDKTPLRGGAAESIDKKFDESQWGLPMAGIVEAGAFRPREDFCDLQETIPFERDPNFLGAKQYAFEVHGDSMNLEGIIEGGFVRAVDFVDSGLSLRSGDLVVVEKRISGGHLAERTVKQVQQAPSGAWLVPRSTNPKHEKILVPHGGEDTSDEVVILGVVTAYFKLFTR